MKKSIKIFLLIIVSILILVSALIVFGYSDTITLKNQVKPEEIEIFIPDSRADKYKDFLEFTFDAWCIYEYELTEKEIDKVEKDVNKGLWKKLIKSQKNSFVGYYFYPSITGGEIWQEGFDLSDEVYTYKYNDYTFIYDKGNASYYCVYISL